MLFIWITSIIVFAAMGIWAISVGDKEDGKKMLWGAALIATGPLAFLALIAYGVGKDINGR